MLVELHSSLMHGLYPAMNMLNVSQVLSCTVQMMAVLEYFDLSVENSQV